MNVTLTEKEVQKFKEDCTRWSNERSNIAVQAFSKNCNGYQGDVNGMDAAKRALADWGKANPFPKLFPDA